MQASYFLFRDQADKWLEVPLNDLAALGLTHLISDQSYQHGRMAYLCGDDRLTFWSAYRKHFLRWPRLLTCYRDRSPIPTFEHYEVHR